MTSDTVALSVILPCHAGASIVARSVTSLLAYLPSVAPSWEVIVVDDGGNDFLADPLPVSDGVVVVRHQRNLGKGAAVRSGMAVARGTVRVFTDADLPYDRELIAAMQHLILTQGFHMVVGDRTLPASQYTPATGIRRVLSSVASWFIGSLVTGGFHDTQCGIKAIRGDVADLLFPLVRTPGFAFDVEVLYLALKHGLDVKRIPVRLRRNASSSVRPLRDALRGVAAIVAIKRRQLRGEYAAPALGALVAFEVGSVLRRYGIESSRP